MLKLISFLDSATPFIQAFDFLLMLACGVYCIRSVRRQKNTTVMLLAICCFVSAAILLGFFLSASHNNHPLLPLLPQVRNVAYLIARLFAPFELLLFAIAIILVARRNRG
jgi:lysylphosphatidylglycerol synthetase-like protein (DUF2156 family)